jgi:hypothetical protein
VALPSPHHQLAVREDLAQLQQETATVIGLTPGSGQVSILQIIHEFLELIFKFNIFLKDRKKLPYRYAFG